MRPTDAGKLYKPTDYGTPVAAHYFKNNILLTDILRKCAYNIARLLQMENSKERENIPDVIEDVCDNLEIGFKMIFQSIPSRY